MPDDKESLELACRAVMALARTQHTEPPSLSVTFWNKNGKWVAKCVFQESSGVDIADAVAGLYDVFSKRVAEQVGPMNEALAHPVPSWIVKPER